MKKYALLTLAVAGMMNAQIPTSHSGEIRVTWNQVKGNLQRMVDAMPEDQYGFKPTADIRSFGELVAHVADAQNLFCSMVTGKPRPESNAKKTSKADLTAAMKESIAGCDAAWDSLTEANMGQTVGTGGMARTRLATLEYNTIHSSEEYGYMAVYLRLKGIVPPSSAGRGPGR